MWLTPVLDFVMFNLLPHLVIQCLVRRRTEDKKLSNATRIYYYINWSCDGEEIVLSVARCVFYTYDWISNKFVFQAHSFFNIKATFSIGTEQRQWYSILVPSQKRFPLDYHTHIIQVMFNLSAAPAAPPESRALWFAQWLLQETCGQRSEVKLCKVETLALALQTFLDEVCHLCLLAPKFWMLLVCCLATFIQWDDVSQLESIRQQSDQRHYLPCESTR